MGIAPDWYKIGIELMETNDEEELRIMKIQYSLEMMKGATEMLEFWLRKKTDASWNQLIAVLRMPHIGLTNLAFKIEKMLLAESKYIVVVSCYKDDIAGITQDQVELSSSIISMILS